MTTRRFWTQVAERTVKTFAQALAAVLVASGAGLLSADWATALSTAGMAAFVSVLTSIGSLRFGPADSPSVVADPPAELPQESPAPAPVRAAA